MYKKSFDKVSLSYRGNGNQQARNHRHISKQMDYKRHEKFKRQKSETLKKTVDGPQPWMKVC